MSKNSNQPDVPIMKSLGAFLLFGTVLFLLLSSSCGGGFYDTSSNANNLAPALFGQDSSNVSFIE